jgi:hypothetical protein
MTLQAIDTVVTHQALIMGSVRDALTNLPLLRAPTVTLMQQATATQPARPYPLAARLSGPGNFVFVGNPYTTFPRLSGGATLALSLAVSAAGYQPAVQDFTLNATQLQRQPGTIMVADSPVPVTLLDAPLFTHDFALSPLPVQLAGRVVEADNRERPIANAQVRVTAPAAVGPATTDAAGFFALPNLPVARSVTVQVTHAAFDTLDTIVQLDYRYPVNQQLFALTT